MDFDVGRSQVGSTLHDWMAHVHTMVDYVPLDWYIAFAAKSQSSSIAFPFHAFVLVASSSPLIQPLLSIVLSLPPFKLSTVYFLFHLLFHLHLGQAYSSLAMDCNQYCRFFEEAIISHLQYITVYCNISQ